MAAPAGIADARRANSAGERALRAGDLAEAEDSFAAALEWASGAGDRSAPCVAADAQVGLGRICLARNDFRAADRRFAKAQRLCPEAPDGFYWAGCAAAHDADYSRAERFLGAALVRDSGLGKAYVQRAYVRVRRAREDLALTDLYAAARCGPLDDRARLLVATLLLSRGRWEQAESFAAEAAEDPVAAAVLGTAQDRQGRDEDALAAYERAMAGGVRDDAILLRHGVISYGLGRLEAGAESWSELHDRYPQHSGFRRASAPAPRVAAFAAAEQGEWERAASLLHRGDGEPELIDALVCGLGGYRSDGLERLGRLVRNDPTDHRIGHVHAAMLLHALSAEDAPEGASWEACIGAWMSLLHNENFTSGWRRDAERRYGRELDADTVTSLHANLRELIEKQLVEHGTGRDVLLLSREDEAARVLGELGGLPLPGAGGARLVCGPLRIAELGLERHFGEFVARLGDSDERLADLLRHFSLLGIAGAQLAAGRPAEAAELAMDLRCPSCRKRTPPGACEPGCPEFDRHNPAFAARADKHAALAEAGASLAVQALFEAARTEITKPGMNAAEAARCWREADRVAREFGRSDAVRRLVADTALGRAEACARKENWTDAVAVLDAALDVVGTGDADLRDRLTTRLAAMLTTRGVETFNKDQNAARAAHDDLRRAVELSPHLLRSRLNLGLILRARAYDELRERDVRQALHLLNEAIQQFELGLAGRPGHERLRAERDRTREERNGLVRRRSR
ncbi:hypothetical protein [Saccharopolyspora taberi]|uniref:Tetratricopeptide repeat protein n=1 Tax=Saccharopolyspora taberi TaxID=60895 RepID=A0ABN3VDH3_9PSEU